MKWSWKPFLSLQVGPISAYKLVAVTQVVAIWRWLVLHDSVRVTDTARGLAMEVGLYDLLMKVVL